MHRRGLLRGFAAVALCPLCAPIGFAAEGAHWGYEGAHGPDKWGELDAASKLCSAGSQQSPVDIGPTVRAQLPPLDFAWKKTADTIVNNGHTIQLNFLEGSRLTMGNQNSQLLQFHFHRPSEHRIGGKSFPMEVHFVHRDTVGGLDVVGVLITAGKANPDFAKVLATMPGKEGPPVKADEAIDPNGFLPEKRDYYRYLGSLTTPPCAETVDWMLLSNPVEVAANDIEAFAKLYPMNARAAQRGNRRFVLRSA